MQMFKDLDDPVVSSQLQSGALAVIPTDTVYGVVCRAADPDVVERLYEQKGHTGEPGTIIAASTDQLVGLGLKARYLKAVEQYWPNPLTVVVPCGPELAYVHLGKGSLAVRIPADEGLRSLLAQTGPLLTTAALSPAGTVAGTIAEARARLGGVVAVYVDGGNLSGRLPSTLIRIVDDAVEVLREGAVKVDEYGRIVE